MDIYKRIKIDHEKHRELADKLAKTSGDSPERHKLLKALKEEVENHAAAEEQSFYAALIEKPDGQEQARHSVSEHKEAADLIEELEKMDMSNAGWIQTFKKLKEELEHHMDEEEDEVFPLAKSLLNKEEAVDLATKFDRRKANEAKAA